MVKTILATTRRYYWELGPFFEFLAVNWPGQEVTVLGDAEPAVDFPAMHYVQVPDQFLTDGTWTAARFSDGVKWHLGNLEDDHVLLLLTDYWLYDPVDVPLLEKLSRWLAERPNVARLGVQRGWTLQHGAVRTETVDGVDFYECPANEPQCFLLMSFYPALWKRKALLEIWRDNWTPWDCENDGTQRLRFEFPHYRSVLPDPAPLRRCFASYSQGGYVERARVPAHLWPVVEKWIPDGFSIR